MVAVVQPQERADRRLQVRRARRAQEDGVRGRGQVLRLGEAERVGHGGGPSAARRLGCRRRPRIRNDQVRLFRDERSLVLPRCHPRSALCRTRDRRILRGGPRPVRSIGAALYRWRSAPEPTGRPLRPGRCRVIVRRPAFGPGAPGSIRRRRHPGSHQPPGLCDGARRVLVPIKARIRVWREYRGRPSGASRAQRPRVVGQRPRGVKRPRAARGTTLGRVTRHPVWRVAAVRRADRSLASLSAGGLRPGAGAVRAPSAVGPPAR